MFHAGGHKGVNTRGRSSGFSRGYPHFLGHIDWKAPLRCGILFCTFACILFVIGVILTWLGIRRRVHDVFGESVPITGPILLAVGGLMLLLAFRQFYMAHVSKKAHKKALESKELGETVISAIAEQDEDVDDDEGDFNKNKAGVSDLAEACVSIDDTCEKPPLISGSYYDPSMVTSTAGESVSSGGYVWPPVSIQSPAYSMAMMVYKDPALAYGPYTSASGPTETYSTGPVVATGADMVGYDDGAHAGVTSAAAASASNGGNAVSTSPSQQPHDTAVLDTPSTTLPQQTNPVSTASIPSQNSVASPTSGGEPPKIFPAGYLAYYQRSGGNTSTTASAGISNLPNPTAFMMLRTLEVQETI